MTHDPSDDRLDSLLSQWVDQSDDANQLDNLRDRIVSSLTETQRVVRVSATPDGAGARLTRWQGMSGVVAASAAMLLLAIAFFRVTELKQDDIGSTSRLPPEYAWLRDDQLRDKAALLLALEDMFNGQLIWAAESPEGLELGLNHSASDPAVRSHDGVRVVVRVVVERRQIGTEKWQLTWARDVLSRDEEFVTTTPDEDGSVLRLWTYRLPDGQIAVDSEIELRGSNPLHAQSSGLQQDRTPVRIADVRDHETEYRVFQTVAVLDEGVI